MESIRIAVPSKGRLREPTLRLLSAAGLEPAYEPGRSLIVPTVLSMAKLVYIRPEDVAHIVASSAASLGITGLDYVLEADSEVEICLRLGFGNSKLVLAVPNSSRVERAEDLEGARIATKYVNIARRFFEARGVAAKIVRISGSAEVMPRLGAADAIVDVVSTGTTLMMHGLRPVETVMESEAVLISRTCSGDPRVESIVETLKGVVNARTTRMVMMNVPDDRLRDVLSVLPSMSGPAITRLESNEKMWEVITAVQLQDLLRVVYEAKKRGARDIVVLNVERVVP